MISYMGAGLKSIVGKGIGAYTRMPHTARDKALERLRQEGSDLNADAGVMMRFDSGSMVNDMQSVVAYGTAVRFI